MAAELQTSLETFLVFLNLHKLGLEAPSFAKLSELLKQDDLLKSSASFEASRLEPNILQDLYLKTLKDEAKAQAQLRSDQDGRPSSNPRKRKLSSPIPETLEEASHYTHLLPQLLDRLYFQYQRDAIKAVQYEEQNFYSLQNKNGNVERVEKEGRQPNAGSNSRPGSHAVPSIQTLLRHDDETSEKDVGARQSSVHNGSHYSESTPPMANGGPLPARPTAGTDTRVTSNDPRYVQASGYKPISAENGLPYLPPPQHPAQSHPLPAAGQDAQRRRPSQPVPSPSSRVTQGSIPPPERSSASPIILPPVSGMLRSQASPTGPLDPVNEHGQPYRPASNMSPRPGQSALARPHKNQLPPPRNYAQPPYAYHDGHQYPPYSYNQQGYYPQYPPASTNASQGGPYSAIPAYSSPVPTHPSQQLGYYSGSGYYNQPTMSTPYAQQPPPRYAGQQTPMSDGKVRPFRPLSVNTSTSSTKWKHVDLDKGAKRPGSPTRPLSREVSPISDRGHSPEKSATPAQRRGAKNQDQLETATKAVKPTSTRGGRGRGRARGGRVGSASASARGRTRSLSVASHTDELSIDAKTSTARKIKPEPSIASAVDDETSTMDESSRKPGRGRRGIVHDDATPSMSRATNKRRRGDSSLPLPSPSLRSRLGAAPLTPKAAATQRPGYILATRNFNKISSTLMQSVTGHKDAYLFAKPLTERDAPGYNKLIYRPQDLKGIKAALTAGSKAVAAIAEEAGEEVGAGSKCIWIPETEAIVPSKGIVNSAQLEKELLRLFANAVMFNPDVAENRGFGPAFHTRARTLEEHESGGNDEGGTEAGKLEIGVAKPVDGAVVQDAREMCADMEEAFDGWRDVGKVDDAEARDAPVVTTSSRDREEEEDEAEGGEQGEEAEAEVDEAAGDEEEEKEPIKEPIEEPRPKRRRRGI